MDNSSFMHQMIIVLCEMEMPKCNLKRFKEDPCSVKPKIEMSAPHPFTYCRQLSFYLRCHHEYLIGCVVNILYTMKSQYLKGSVLLSIRHYYKAVVQGHSFTVYTIF